MDKHIHVHTATVPGTPHDHQRMGDYWMIWYSHRSMSTHRVWQSEARTNKTGLQPLSKTCGTGIGIFLPK